MIPHLSLIENSSFQRNFLLFTSAKDFCHHSVTSRCLIILVPFLYVVFSYDFRLQVIILFHEVSVLCFFYWIFFCKQNKLWGKLGLGFEIFFASLVKWIAWSDARIFGRIFSICNLCLQYRFPPKFLFVLRFR